jgi:hypothetical protein
VEVKFLLRRNGLLCVCIYRYIPCHVEVVSVNAYTQQAIPSLGQYKINFNMAWNVSVNAYTQQDIPSL